MNRPAIFPIFDFLNHFEAVSARSNVIKAQHRSLFIYLVHLGSRLNSRTTFTVTYQDGMNSSKIGCYKTYLKALKELDAERLIDYQPGKNAYQAPVITLVIHGKEAKKRMKEYTTKRKKVGRGKNSSTPLSTTKSTPQSAPYILHNGYNEHNGNPQNVPDEKAAQNIRFNPNTAN